MPRKLRDRTIRPFVRGQASLRAEHLNSIVDAVNRTLIGVAAPVQRQPRGKSGGSPLVILTLVSHQGDYLECEDDAANTVYVAKPYELRQTPFDGQSISGVTYSYGTGFPTSQERTATSDSNPSQVEVQYITPEYRVGAEIYAVRTTTPTGVLNPVGPTGAQIEYLEINQGRAFAWDEV